MLRAVSHHAVINESSTTTRVRIVFDDSAKTTNGRSLNDLLCIGSKLQNDLNGVLLNWRIHKFVFTADIQKKYRRFDMHPDDAQYKRIWWYDENGEPKLYFLTTVTFGTSSAPCTAILTIHQIAEDEKSNFPLAYHVLKHEIYVDDVQSGKNTVKETLVLRDQVIGALDSAGMKLRKWASNDIRILEGIPAEHQSNSNSLQLHNQDTIKILGMFWLPNNDCFKFKLKFDLPKIITKRSVLSTIARLYDPLGYITPVIIVAKGILKDVWKNEQILEWDSTLLQELNIRWNQFANSLPLINQISVPRWIEYNENYIKGVEIHTFCDGSTIAYATAVFLRLQYQDESIHTHLLVAKSRITPTKPLTIPKIELNGAALAVRLTTWVTKQLNIQIDRIYYWSDATIVLYWIRGDLDRWKTYVANRVTKILKYSKPEQWYHVGTKDNPTDCATRGLSPDQLVKHNLWWKGSNWLSESKSKWPTFDLTTLEINGEDAELKPLKIHLHFTIHAESIIYKYSLYNRLIRMNAWVLRFNYNFIARYHHQPRTTGPLLVKELHRSLLNIVRLIQLEAFGADMTLINSQESLPNKCKIRGLAPFINDGILQVRGRLQKANIPYQQKHPMILPKSHYFTKLLIEDAHIRTLHGGTQTVVPYLRQQFWIVDDKKTVSHQLKKCFECIKNNPKIITQLMGNLPYHRVNPPQRPFLATEVDYTGAFDVKASRFRGNTTYKCYIAVFVCLATKAIHLEAVTGMTTKHFLWALQRFIGRRGICNRLGHIAI